MRFEVTSKVIAGYAMRGGGSWKYEAKGQRDLSWS